MRASYAAAIRWLAYNDDCRWIYAADPIATNAAWLVADVFGKTVAKVLRDVFRRRDAEGLGHAG